MESRHLCGLPLSVQALVDRHILRQGLDLGSHPPEDHSLSVIHLRADSQLAGFSEDDTELGRALIVRGVIIVWDYVVAAVFLHYSGYLTAGPVLVLRDRLSYEHSHPFTGGARPPVLIVLVGAYSERGRQHVFPLVRF